MSLTYITLRQKIIESLTNELTPYKKENTMTKSNKERIINLRDKLNIYKEICENDEMTPGDIDNVCNDLGIGEEYSTTNVLHSVRYDSSMKEDVESIDCILKCLEEYYDHIRDDLDKMIDCLWKDGINNTELRALKLMLRSKFISVMELLDDIDSKKEAFVRAKNIIKFGTPVDLDKMEEIVGK